MIVLARPVAAAGAYVRSMYSPDSIEVWAGTSQGLLLRYDGKAWTRYW